MRWVMLIGSVFGIARYLGQVILPDSLYDEIDHGSYQRVFAQLTKHPEWINAVEHTNEQTPLHIAVQRDRPYLVEWLIKHGANVNATAFNKFTPLHLACEASIAKILLQAGARTDTRDVYGMTPLQFAASAASTNKDRLGVVNAIRTSGVPTDLITALYLNERDVAKSILRAHPMQAFVDRRSFQTPLHIAAHQGDLEMAKLLIEAGAEIDANHHGFIYGYTPLYAAVSANKREMVEFLLSKGANPHGFDWPLRPALLLMSPEIEALLKKYGARVRPT